MLMLFIAQTVPPTDSHWLLHTLVGAACVFFGSLLNNWINHTNTEMSERASRRHDLRTPFLIEAYRTLTKALRDDTTDLTELTALLSDLELFGTSKEVQAAQALQAASAQQRKARLQDLLALMRADLRRTLLMSIPKTEGNSNDA